MQPTHHPPGGKKIDPHFLVPQLTLLLSPPALSAFTGFWGPGKFGPFPKGPGPLQTAAAAADGQHLGNGNNNNNNDSGGDDDGWTCAWPGGVYTVTGCEWNGNPWAGGPGGWARGGGAGGSPWGLWGKGWTW